MEYFFVTQRNVSQYKGILQVSEITLGIDWPLLPSYICEIDPKERIDPFASPFFAWLSVLQ